MDIKGTDLSDRLWQIAEQHKPEHYEQANIDRIINGNFYPEAPLAIELGLNKISSTHRIDLSKEEWKHLVWRHAACYQQGWRP